MLNVDYLSMAELEAGMDYIRQTPSEHGTLKMIVRRPQEDERALIDPRRFGNSVFTDHSHECTLHSVARPE
jgi:hypothetical protein